MWGACDFWHEIHLSYLTRRELQISKMSAEWTHTTTNCHSEVMSFREGSNFYLDSDVALLLASLAGSATWKKKFHSFYHLAFGNGARDRQPFRIIFFKPWYDTYDTYFLVVWSHSHGYVVVALAHYNFE